MSYCYIKIMTLFVEIMTPMRIFTESHRTFVFHSNILLSDIDKMTMGNVQKNKDLQCEIGRESESGQYGSVVNFLFGNNKRY